MFNIHQSQTRSTTGMVLYSGVTNHIYPVVEHQVLGSGIFYHDLCVCVCLCVCPCRPPTYEYRTLTVILPYAPPWVWVSSHGSCLCVPAVSVLVVITFKIRTPPHQSSHHQHHHHHHYHHHHIKVTYHHQN